MAKIIKFPLKKGKPIKDAKQQAFKSLSFEEKLDMLAESLAHLDKQAFEEKKKFAEKNFSRPKGVEIED